MKDVIDDLSLLMLRDKISIVVLSMVLIKIDCY